MVSEKGRTAALWVQYHHLVQLVKDYIRAERLSDFKLHLSVVCEMLSIFASAGHSQYAKGARLYLELMDKYLVKGSDLEKMFTVNSLHTVRYSMFIWAAIWTDLCIEQTLMRQIKSRGGLTDGRLRNQESAHKVWVALLDHFSAVKPWIRPAIVDKRKLRPIILILNLLL